MAAHEERVGRQSSHASLASRRGDGFSRAERRATSGFGAGTLMTKQIAGLQKTRHNNLFFAPSSILQW